MGIPGTETEEHRRGVMVEVFWDQDDNETLCVSGHSNETPMATNVELTRPPLFPRRASVGRGGTVGYVIDVNQVRQRDGKLGRRRSDDFRVNCFGVIVSIERLLIYIMFVLEQCVIMCHR